uniref:Uncharacterized protein n=1 Tax=Arundo donax TaxID=35708 RepID=A0A0A8ZUM7_ARUDO
MISVTSVRAGLCFKDCYTVNMLHACTLNVIGSLPMSMKYR